jgi:hypothetical protein
MTEIKIDRLFPRSQLYKHSLYVKNISLYFKDWVKDVDLLRTG